MCKENFKILLLTFLLVIFGKASANNGQTQNDQHEKLKTLQQKIQSLNQENLEIRSKNLKLSDQISRMASRQQDIVLALTWKYDELEKKAQVYYNSLQQMKESANRMIMMNQKPAAFLDQVVEENLNLELKNVEQENSQMRSSLMPLLYANSISRKKQQDKVTGQISELNHLKAMNSATSKSTENKQNSKSEESESDKPVARSYHFSPKLTEKDLKNFSITLKSALPIFGSSDQEHKISHDVGFKKSHPRTGLIPKFADIWFE